MCVSALARLLAHFMFGCRQTNLLKIEKMKIKINFCNKKKKQKKIFFIINSVIIPSKCTYNKYIYIELTFKKRRRRRSYVAKSN